MAATQESGQIAQPTYFTHLHGSETGTLLIFIQQPACAVLLDGHKEAR